MTKEVETAFDETFSEPPQVSVVSGRTHCDACGATLDPSVMHQCHGNQEYQAPVISSMEITEAGPECDTGEGRLPDLTNYSGVCPECHGAKEFEGTHGNVQCDLCDGTGRIE